MQTVTIPLHEIEENVVIRRIEESVRFNFKGVHKHNFYEILYFTDPGNNAVHYIDFAEYPVKNDCIYLLKPGQVYRMDRTTQKGYLVAIKAEYFDSLRSNLRPYLYYIIPDIIQMDKPDLQLSEQIITAILNELSGKQRQELINAMTNTLITHCMLPIGIQIKESGVDSRVLNLISLIDEYFMEEREISFYANKISLSEKRLGVLTKLALGVTIKQLIQKRLLLEAKRLISYDSSSIKSIAFKLGFKDTSYFSRFFKTYSGITPEQFKATLK